MKMKIFFSAVVLILMVSCAKILVPTPAEGYNQLKLRPHTNFTDHFDFSKAKELKLIYANDFKLALTDSVVQYKDSLLSNYQVFKFTSTASQWHRINVVAYCFVRRHGEFYVFIPQIKVFDKNLHEIEIKRDSSVEVNQHYDKSFFRTAWLFGQLKPNDYYLVVYSDNSNLGHLVSSDTYDMPVGALIIPETIVINSSLYGDFRIRVENL
jgi:hypothetical protein